MSTSHIDIRLPSLDGLRGWMALWVYFTHVLTMATLPLDKESGAGVVLANGAWPVAVFILLSGFVISGSAARQGYRQFIIKRAFRIFPVYLTCLALSVLVLDLSIEALKTAPWDMKRREDRLYYLEESARNFWVHLGLHIPMLHGLVPDSILPATSYAFMGQAWSLTLEWQFYIVAPFLYALAGKWDNTTIRYAWLLLLLWASNQHRQGSFLLAYLWLFYAGHLAHCGTREKSLLKHFLLTAVMLLAFKKNIAPLALFYGTLWLATNRPSGLYTRWLSGKTSLFLGDISYCLYCVHMVAIYTTSHTLIHTLNVHDRFAYGALLVSCALALSALLSIALRKWIETPGIQLGSWLASKKTVHAAHSDNRLSS